MLMGRSPLLNRAMCLIQAVLGIFCGITVPFLQHRSSILIHVSTQSGALAAPTLNNPPNNATGVATQPTFSWSQVSGNLGYRIIVSTNLADLTTDSQSQGNLNPSNGFNTTVSQ